MSECGCTSGYICNTHRTIKYTAPIGIISGGIVGGHLGSPTPEQIDHDIIGELSRLRQKVAVLEDNKKFYEDIAKDISNRLNEAEGKLEAIEEQFLHFIELRKIKGTG